MIIAVAHLSNKRSEKFLRKRSRVTNFREISCERGSDRRVQNENYNFPLYGYNFGRAFQDKPRFLIKNLV